MWHRTAIPDRLIAQTALHHRLALVTTDRLQHGADHPAAEKYLEVPALRPAYYGYYHGVEPLPEPTLEMWFGDDRIGFLFPMRPDEDRLALEIQPEEFESFRSRPQEVFEEGVRALPGMERRMHGAVLEGHVLGTRGIDNFFRKPYGPGWALTGDAAYLNDPSRAWASATPSCSRECSRKRWTAVSEARTVRRRCRSSSGVGTRR